MNRRDILILISAMGIGAIPGHALAKDGEDGGSGKGSDDGGTSGGGSDDSGSGKGSDDDNSGKGSGDDNSGKGSGDDKPDSDNHEDGHVDDHDDARRAVESSDAMPLADILKIVKPRLEGTLIDVTLMKRGGELVYRFKYIDPKGTVRRAYFGALTGDLR